LAFEAEETNGNYNDEEYKDNEDLRDAAYGTRI
jgi:hypothetical protein